MVHSPSPRKLKNRPVKDRPRPKRASVIFHSDLFRLPDLIQVGDEAGEGKMVPSICLLQVTTMSAMFLSAGAANPDTKNWDVSKVLII